MNKTEANEITCRVLGSTIVVPTSFEEFSTSHIFALSVNCIMIIPNILLNAISVITILQSAQLKSKPSYFIILVQSVIDLAVGAIAYPSIIVYLVRRIKGTSYCFETLLIKKPLFLAIGISMITLFVLTMERYIAILHPYSYKTTVTKRRILTCVAFGSAVLFVVVILTFPNPSPIFAAIFKSLLFSFIAFAYTKIFLVIRKLNRSSNRPSDANLNLTRKKLFLREIKQAKSCFTVVVCFLVLALLPATAYGLLTEKAGKSESLALNIWALTIFLLNSTANSVIFFWTKAMFRKEAKERLSITCAR